MRQVITSGLLWFSAVGCGLLAGVYFAFSTFIMSALARTGPAQGIAAMNVINVEIVKSLFLPFFLGTTPDLRGAGGAGLLPPRRARGHRHARRRRHLCSRHVRRNRGVQRAAK